MRREILLLVGTMSLGVPAFAADLSVKKTASFKSSPDAIWSMIADYCGIPKWHPAVAKCDVVAGTNNKVGAIRVLTLGTGAAIKEELVQHDAKARTYSYKILDSPLPVTSYVATITVLPGTGGGSVVEWKSTFKATAGTEDAAAKAVIEGIYDAGLASLQAKDATK